MSSSTSTSRSRRFLILVGITVLVTCGLAWFYAQRVHPELVFWQGVMDEKMRYIDELPEEKPRVFFIGGSSCAFSIDPLIASAGLEAEVINLGLHAGTGRLLQLEFGLQQIRAGDVLVLAFESDFWASENPFRHTQLGSQLLFTRKEAFSEPYHHRSLGLKDEWSSKDIRPGGKHVSTLLGKILLRKRIYRYDESNLNPGGFLTYTRETPKASPRRHVSEEESRLSPSVINFLYTLKEYAEEHDFALRASFPWVFAEPDALIQVRDNNQRLALSLAPYLTVLDDPALGASPDPADFSDTLWHLSPAAARHRSETVRDSLAEKFASVEIDNGLQMVQD